MVGKDLFGEVTYEQRPGRSDEVSYISAWVKSRVPR